MIDKEDGITVVPKFHIPVVVKDVMIVIIMYLFSIYFIQTGIWFVESAPITDDVRAALLNFYGGMEVSMLSLFMAISGGDDWGVSPTG